MYPEYVQNLGGWVAAYQEKLKIADEIRHGYELTLAAKDVELVAAKEELTVAKKELAVANNELGVEKVRYAELMEESVGRVGIKAMCKVRADLYREYHEGNASAWDLARAIWEYEEAISWDESDDESSAANQPAPNQTFCSSISFLGSVFVILGFLFCNLCNFSFSSCNELM